MPHTTVLAFDNTSVPTRLNTRPRPLLSQSPTAGPSTFLKPVSLPIRPRTSKNDVTAAPNIRQLRIAFEETPAKLRELEQGWRARRRRVLGDVTEIKQIPAAGSSRQIPSEISEVALSARETDPIGDQPESPRQVHRPRRRISGSNPATYRVMPPRTQELPSAHRDEVPLGRPGSSHISLRVPVAPPTPPASPPTPPRQPGLSPHSQRIVEPGSPARLNRIHPIMAQPLPPTSHPVPISRSTPRDTIRVLPFGSPIELAISLHSGRRKIVVLQGGLELNLEGEAVRLVEQKAWGRRERKEWEMVQALVERVKRSTPRVGPPERKGLIRVDHSGPSGQGISYVRTPDDHLFLSSRYHPLLLVWRHDRSSTAARPFEAPEATNEGSEGQGRLL